MPASVVFFVFMWDSGVRSHKTVSLAMTVRHCAKRTNVSDAAISALRLGLLRYVRNDMGSTVRYARGNTGKKRLFSSAFRSGGILKLSRAFCTVLRTIKLLNVPLSKNANVSS